MAAPTTIRVALDWTPNTIHTGLFLAQSRGLYAGADLDVQLLPPDEDYTKSPAKRLETGEVDLAICPSESCVAYAESGKMQLQAIYAILQRDASALVATKLKRVAELGDGKVYGSYNARYEDAIVKAMVAADGGNGEGVKVERQQGKLSLFEATKSGKVDATWVFVPWEGVEAQLEGTEANYFRMEEFEIPYGYSPVIARNAAAGGVDGEALRKFIRITREAYESVELDAKVGARALKPHCRPERSEEFLKKSQESINRFYSDGSQLGTMSEQRWEVWLTWLEEQKMVEPGTVKVGSLFTNEFHHASKRR
jgi:NitT/TauT family transport system substrate-binding protein